MELRFTPTEKVSKELAAPSLSTRRTASRDGWAWAHFVGRTRLAPRAPPRARKSRRFMCIIRIGLVAAAAGPARWAQELWRFHPGSRQAWQPLDASLRVPKLRHGPGPPRIPGFAAARQAR